MMINKKAGLEVLDCIPIVSTVTSLFHIYNRVFNVKINTPYYNQYLNGKSVVYHIINLIPVINVINVIFYECFKSKKQVSNQQPFRPLESLIPIITPPSSPAILARPRAAGQMTGNVFNDDEIIRVHQPQNILFPYDEDSKMAVSQFSFDKHVVVQEAVEGCSSGVSAMLALDHNKKLDYSLLKNREASSYLKIVEDLRSCDLVPITTELHTLEVYGILNSMNLKQSLEQHGPAIVRIRGEANSMAHWVIVDEIDIELASIRIRDPWHGWSFDVDVDAFERNWQRAWDLVSYPKKDCIIQVQSEIF